MRKRDIYIFAILFFLSIYIFLSSCNNEIKFDKIGWTIKDDIGLHPNRDKMLNDLIHNQKLKGLTYRQLIFKIGEPESNMTGGRNSIYYDIVTDYGLNIDPVSVKSLEFRFDKDSIITDYTINEWRH